MKMCRLCEEMKELWKEQQLLAEFGKELRFIQMADSMDTIPFMLQTAKHSAPFNAIINGYSTPYFRLEKIDEGSCFAQLSLLQPVNLKGHPALTDQDLYALKKTPHRILVKLCSFSAINPVPHELVSRPLPIIESKT
ncbi:CotY/CotZ family spore coat protein [Sporosarcina sp. Marseille-Q4943]|uniref:CotY/CotZ family spore coat protein n=1 Tax=Sporosarcina sp. Marseille-Q4943 TaxID=2942204 RepID=UPI00208DBB8B|nr:CotY/CotZ family spore coat protein [Sporosarcina sp. Marseille-Q4943]